MADDLQFSNKRKFDDPAAGTPPPPRRPTGFSAPIAAASPSPSPSPDSAPPPSYNSVPPPADSIELAKQRAQEIAARLFHTAEAKRPKVENGAADNSSGGPGFGSLATDQSQKPLGQSIPAHVGMAPTFPSYGSQGSSKKIEIPNGRVGVIIGKGGETIKNLQLQSGAKIQVTRDMDADPNAQTRLVELIGTSEQVSRAERLISDVLAEADAGGSGILAALRVGNVQVGAEQFVMQVPNNRVGLIIGKGGETIKNMQAKSGARIQIIPLHLPPGDTSTERTVQIDGTEDQIESAKQLVNEVVSGEQEGYVMRDGAQRIEKVRTNFDWERMALPISMGMFPSSLNRIRNPSMGGGYSQQGYQPRPPTSWGPPGAPPLQQPGYGYMQPGAYPGAPPQYNISQPPYGGYPSSGGGSSGWDQSSNPPPLQTTSGTGYDYYNQQQQQQQPVGGSTPADNNSHNYGQPPPNYNSQGAYGDSTYSQPTAGQQQGYGQDGYSAGYQAPQPQSGYAQPVSNPQVGYDQQQGYGSAPAYGYATSQTQDGSTPAYGTTLPPAQQAPPVPPSATPQGYTGQQPSSTAYSYPSQGNPQPGYGMPPTSQPGYGSQAPAQPGYSQSPSSTQPGYGQPPLGPKAPVQPGYMHGQVLPAQPGYAQGPQPGYGQQQSYSGVPPQSQAGYGQQPYGDSYGGGAYSQPPMYSNDTAATGAYDATSAQTAPSGVAKASPPS